jgi:phosphatidate phosphatase APP1
VSDSTSEPAAAAEATIPHDRATVPDRAGFGDPGAADQPVAPQKPMTPEKPMLHRPARVDYAILRWRARHARAAGYRAAVIPYTGYGSTTWIRVLGRVLLTKEPQRSMSQGEPTGARGWRSFTSVPVDNASVSVRVGDHSEHEVHADRSGIVDAVVQVSLPPGWHTIRLSSEGSEWRDAQVFVIDPATRFGIVSDIDDTVMVTSLPRPMLAAWHTFVVNEHARATTPGMPVLYERLTSSHVDVPVVYLSTGAWNVAPTVTRFLSRNLYPAGPLLLTDWGPTADRWFRSGREHKRASLARLATEFPEIRWLLFGDDGQHDESIYAEFAKEHPDNVTAVCIRRLSPGEAVLAGGTLKDDNKLAAARATSVPWAYAADGAGLADELARLGLLGAEAQQPEVEA